MILCTKCGTTLNDDVKYCTVCGTPVPEPLKPEVGNGEFNLMNRVINMIIKPQEEWKVIETEKADKNKILFGYVLILILIPAIFTVIGSFFFSSIFVKGYLMQYILTYTLPTVISVLAVNFIVVVILSFIISALAPNFGGKKNDGKAMQLVAFSLTPYWVAGILYAIPFIGWLSYAVGIYSIIIFYWGLKHTLRPNKDNEVLYTVIFAILFTAIYGILLFALGIIMGAIFLVQSSIG